MKPASFTGIKFKLLLVFTIFAAGALGAAYFTYSSFTRLLNSVHTLATPNTSYNILQDISNNMVIADANMQSYLMVDDEEALETYFGRMERIDSNLEALRNQPSYQNLDPSVDSLNTLFGEKASLMYNLVLLKNESDYSEVTKKVYSEISSSLHSRKKSEDSTVADDFAPAIKPATLTHIGDDSDEKKNPGFLKSLFHHHDNTEEPQEKIPVVTIRDSDATGDNNSITRLAIAEDPGIDISAVRQILKDIDIEQQRYHRKLSAQEKEILTSDKVIMHKIHSIIDTVQTNEAKNDKLALGNAAFTARRSSVSILSISVAALIISLIFIGIILSDINRNNRYKLQIEEAKRHAEHLANVREEFLSNMSHEIRTPLNAVIGFSEQLSTSPLQKTQKKYVRAIERAGTHLLHTVNDILDLAKIEAGQVSFSIHPFRMGDVFDEVCTILSIKAEQKNIAFGYTADAHCNEFVNGDAFRVRQILYNLVGNALKFTAQGEVAIRCTGKREEDTLHFIIAVHDTGIGIPQEKLESIFENFTQANAETTRKYGGTGLGLAISKKLAEMMQGDLHAESEEQKGSVFTLELSLPLSSAEEIRQLETEVAGTDQKHMDGCSVLVVDDEAVNLMLIQSILKKYGAEVTIAVSGKEALQKIAEKRFDIILADLHMPEMDGHMLAAEIRSQDRHTPVIAITANALQRDKKGLETAGFNDILLKPFRESELMEMIGRFTRVQVSDARINALRTHEAMHEMNGRYSLEELRKFTGDDADSLMLVLRSFIEGNKNNLKMLEDAAGRADIAAIRDIAHKMLPSYQHFHVVAAIPCLRFFETLENTEQDTLEKTISEIRNASEKVFASLEIEIAVLEKQKDVKDLV